VPTGGTKPRGRKPIADVGTDRTRLGQHEFAFDQGGHLAADVERQILGPPAGAGPEIDMDAFVLRADFLQRPDHPTGAGIGKPVNHEHDRILLWIRTASRILMMIGTFFPDLALDRFALASPERFFLRIR
jgi:hypothetical protein